MKLYEAIMNIQYNTSFGIWAEYPFMPDSQARYGQRQFDNGGLLDGKVFFADGVQCGDFVNDYLDGESADEFGEEAAKEMVWQYSQD